MTPLRPVVTLPWDPIAVAEITASAIRADARTGGAVPLSADALYHEDPSRGPNLLLSPAETAARGGGQCFDLVRAEGGYRGTHIGCCRTPGGFHVWLGFDKSGEPIVYDIAKLRGMPGTPDYTGAIYVPIWQPGPGGTPGPAGHDQPPQDIVGALALPAATWADFVVTVGSPLVKPGADLVATRSAVEQELARATDHSKREALGALLAILRASAEPEMRGAVRAELQDVVPEHMSPTAAKLLGALSVLSGRPWRSIVVGAPMMPIGGAYRGPPPLAYRPAPQVIPSGSCPGSCAIPRR